jgi:hypothetical protein
MKLPAADARHVLLTKFVPVIAWLAAIFSMDR